jgi:hypothetical protein
MPHLSIPHLCPQVSALLVLAASLLGPSVTAFSAEVRLGWDAPAQPGLAGYKIYYGISGKSNVTRIDVGNVTTYTVTGLKTNTTYNFCVTAFYTSGNESICSNQVLVNLWPRMYGFALSPAVAWPSRQHTPTSEEPVRRPSESPRPLKS